jgi:DNA polymerase III alpha subunit
MNDEVSNILRERAKIAINIDKLINHGKKKQENPGQLSLFDADNSLESFPILDEPENFDPINMIKKEKELLGFNILHSLFDEYELIRCRYCDSTFNELITSTEPFENKTILAEIREIEYKKSKMGNQYAKVTFSDRNVEEKLYLFGKLYKNNISKCHPGEIYLLTLSSDSEDDMRIRIVNFQPAREVNVLNDCHIAYIKTDLNKLYELRMYVKCYMKGDKQSVVVKVEDLDKIIYLPDKISVDNENILEMRKLGFIIKLR